MTHIEDKKQSVLNKMDQLNNAKVMIVGDIGLDEYVNGSVKRISPEAPVPVLDVFQEESRLGLATNVAQNISSLGGEPILVSVIGNDDTGTQLQSLLEEAKVSSKYLVKDDSRPTTRKLRVMSGHHHIVRVDYEKKKFLSGSMEKAILEKVEANIDSADIVVLQDYAKGVLSEGLCQAVIQIAKKHSKKVLVDPNRNTPLSYYRGAQLMTPNLDEALKLGGFDDDDSRGSEDDLMDVGGKLMSGVEAETMIITRSQDGMSLFENGQAVRVPTFARKVSDVTGAGDTVIAAISLGIAAKLSLEESCVLANYAAGVVVGKIGCVPCFTPELVEYMNSH